MLYPYWKQGPLHWPVTFFYNLTMEKLERNRCMRDQLQLLAAILPQWRRQVASSEALDLLYWIMHVVLYQHIAMAIKTASKVGVCFHCHFICCCPGGRWGNTEQVVAQWRCTVASGIALDMPHWAMPSVLLWRTTVAIKMASGWGSFAHCCLLFPWHYL